MPGAHAKEKLTRGRGATRIVTNRRIKVINQGKAAGARIRRTKSPEKKRPAPRIAATGGEGLEGRRGNRVKPLRPRRYEGKAGGRRGGYHLWFRAFTHERRLGQGKKQTPPHFGKKVCCFHEGGT